MTRMLCMVRGAYLGLVGAYGVTFLLSHWVWLEMRLNLALLLPWGLFAGALAGGLQILCPGVKSLFLGEGALLVVLAILYGREPGALLVLPAGLFREGFGVHWLTLPQINILLLIIILAAHGSWFLKGGKN